MSKEKVFEMLDDYIIRLKKAKKKEKRSDGQPLVFKPFYSCIRLWRNKYYALDIENGGTQLRSSSNGYSYMSQIEIRMGDYKRGGSMACANCRLPKGLEKDAGLVKFLGEANKVFWDCLYEHEVRNQKSFGKHRRRDDFVYFSEEESIIYDEEDSDFTVSVEEIEDTLKRVTRDLKRPDIYTVEADFLATNVANFLVNTEGSRIFSVRKVCYIVLKAKTVDNRNLLIPNVDVFYGLDTADLPGYDYLMVKGEKVVRDLLDIVKSPIQKSGGYPVILDSVNHGYLHHEIVGHYVEGHRQQGDDFGDIASLFMGRVGERVAPEFLSIYDDPTIPGLNGSYKHDEDGVKAQKVLLIENGILKNFLHSRESAGFFKTKSNGHARSDGLKEPVSRMSNLVVKSSNQVSREELIERMQKDCKDKKIPYGLIFENSIGGATYATESVFGTYPINIFRITPRGKKTRVRGIHVVGTPQEVAMKIVQTSNNYQTNPGGCGAESGKIYVSETAPDAYVRSLAINRVKSSEYDEVKNPVLK
ncbi:TldD/PmbA family protein [Patescibacteria group bacterium]